MSFAVQMLARHPPSRFDRHQPDPLWRRRASLLLCRCRSVGPHSPSSSASLPASTGRSNSSVITSPSAPYCNYFAIATSPARKVAAPSIPRGLSLTRDFSRLWVILIRRPECDALGRPWNTVKGLEPFTILLAPYQPTNPLGSLYISMLVG